MYVTQSTNEIMVNVGAIVKNWLIGILVKMIICPNTCDCEFNKACTIDEQIHIKNCSCEKCLIDNAVSACEDELLYTTEAWLDYKKVTYGKSNCLIHSISLVIILLLLLVVVFIVVIFIIQNIDQNKNIYYYFTKPTI